MNALKRFGAIVPGSATFLVAKWLDLFSLTHLAYPDWQEAADRIALGIGTVLAVVLAIVLGGARKAVLRRVTLSALLAFLLLLAGCWVMWLILGARMPAGDVRRLQDVWEGLYILAMALLVVTTSAAALMLAERSSKTFWIVVGLSALIAALAVYALWIWNDDDKQKLALLSQRTERERAATILLPNWSAQAGKAHHEGGKQEA